MKPLLGKLFPVLLFATTLVLTGCFEKKKEEATTQPSTDAGGSVPPSNIYDYVTLAYPTVSGTYKTGEAWAGATPVTNITGASLTNFKVTPSLPYGLSLNAATGEISGTATTNYSVYGNWKNQNYTFTADKPNNEGVVTAVVNFGFSSQGGTPVDNSFEYSDMRLGPSKNLVLIVGQPMTTLTMSYEGPQDITFFSCSNCGNSPSIQEIDLDFDFFTGTLSGTPTVARGPTTYYFSAGSELNAELTIEVIEGAPTNLTYANENATYPVGYAITTNTPTASGGNVSSYSVSPALPAGLSLNTTTGEITGTPTTIQSSANYTITASNIVGSTTKQISIAVANSPPASLSYVYLTTRYTVGASITANTPIVTGGGQVTSYSVTPALPAGLSLDTTTGHITGRPTTMTAAASYTVTASNAAGSANRVISFNVVNPGSHVLYATTGSYIRAYSVDVVTGEPIFLGKEISSDVNSRLLFHPSADCAFGYSGSNVKSFSINKSAHGELTQVSSVGGLSGVVNMVISSDGKFLFALNNQDPLNQFVMKYEVNPGNCSLSNASSSSVFYHTEHVVRDIATSGNNLYILYKDAKIRHSQFDSNHGGLTFQADYSMSLHSNPPQIGLALGNGLFLAMHPAGTHLYATDDLKSIQRFTLNISGELQSEDPYVDSGTFLTAQPAIDPVNNLYVTGYINGSTHGGLKKIKLLSNGTFDQIAAREYNDVATGFRSISTVGVHASDSGSYIYSTYTPANQPTTAARLKVESNGAITPVGLGLVGNISGY